MGGKRKKYNQGQKPDLIKSLADLSLEELNAIRKTAPIAFQSKLQSSLNSMILQR